MTFDFIHNVRCHLLSFLLGLILAEDITELESGYVTKMGLKEGCLGANYGIYLSKCLHGAEIGKHDVCWNQVDVPKHKVGVEIDDCLHTDVRQIRQISHETSHNVKHDASRLKAVSGFHINKRGRKFTQRGVTKGEGFKED